EAQLYYSYLEKSESLKNKFRRSESEAKAQFKSAILALEKEFLDKKKENSEDLSSLKGKLKEQKAQLKLELNEKIKGFDQAYIEELSKITPPNLKELKT